MGFNYITKCKIFFCILAVNPYGSSVDFQWADGRYKMWGVILRSGNHPIVGFENQNNLCGNLLVGNVSWVVVHRN